MNEKKTEVSCIEIRGDCRVKNDRVRKGQSLVMVHHVVIATLSGCVPDNRPAKCASEAERRELKGETDTSTGGLGDLNTSL